MAASRFRSVTNRVLAMKFAAEFIMIYPLYPIMFGERGGLTAAQVGLILGAGFALSVLLEIPTGVIADRWPRKYVLVSAMMIKTLGFATWLAFPSFTGYLAGAALLALDNALQSGALQAYLYGALGEGAQSHFGKFWARVNAMVMVSYTTAYVLASLVGVRYNILLIASALACVVALLIAWTLPRDHLVTMDTRPRILRGAVGHIVNTPSLMRLLLSAVVVLGLAELVIEFQSLYYHQVGVAIVLVPIVMAAGNLLGALSFWTLGSWEGFLDRHKTWLMVIASLVLAMSATGGIVVAVVGMMAFARFVRVLQVQFESKIQHLANEEARATISSIGAFAAKLLAGVLAALIGLMAIDEQVAVPLRAVLLAGAAIFVAGRVLSAQRLPKAQST